MPLTIDAPDDAIDHSATATVGLGWARARMWDQYAEKHSGVCLVFDRARLTETACNSLVGQDLAPPYYRHVEYTDDPFQPLIGLDTFGNDISTPIQRYIENHNDQFYFRKNTDWRTEFKYRFVVTASTPDDDFVFFDYGDSLQAVIVGHAFPSWQYAGAMQLCEQHDAEAQRISWLNGRPKLLPLTPTS